MPAIASPPTPASAQAPPASTQTPPAGAPGADDAIESKPWMDDVNSDIDTLDAAGSTPPPETKPPAGETKPPKTGTSKPQTETEKAAVSAAAATAGEADKTPSNIRDLRKGYEEQKKKILYEYEPELGRLRKEVEELRKSPQVTQTKEQQEKAKTLEARNKELEQEIRFHNYRKSQDFIDKYEKPYQAAWEKARRDLAEVEVALAGGGTRVATDDDLMLLAGMPLGAARRKANEMFGDSADDIMFHVRRISELSDSQTEALATARKEAETLAQRESDNAKTSNEARIQHWTTANNELATKYPKIFGPVDGETEGNTLLQKGFALTDLRYAPTTLTKERFALLPQRFREELQANGGKLSVQSVARLDAIIRNKAANHDRQVHRVNALQKRVSDLEKTLKEYEDSAPGGRAAAPGARGGGAGHYLDDPNAELEKLDNPNLS